MVELPLHIRAEDQVMRGAAEVEHADLIALPHPLPFVGGDLAAGHFRAVCQYLYGVMHVVRAGQHAPALVLAGRAVRVRAAVRH